MRSSTAAFPPGPPGIPLFGNMLQYMRDPTGSFIRSRGYGDVSSFRFFTVPVLVLSSAEAVEHVLVRNARNYVKDKYQREIARELFGDGLLMSEGEHWKRQRRMIQPSFHKERVRGYAQQMVEATEAWLARWRAGEVRDLYTELVALTLDIVGRTLFGSKLEGRAAEVSRSLAAVMEFVMEISGRVIPLPRWVPTPRQLRYRAAIASLDRLCEALIQERRASGEKREDLLGMMLEARDEDDGGGMSDRQLRDEVVTLVLAGHETTALTLTYALWLLGRHPEAEATLREELSRVLGGRTPTVEDLPALSFTEFVIKESMRLYPPAWSLSRAAVNDDEICGVKVKAGQMVSFAPWALHRDPRYFEAPEAFRPERWAHDFEHKLPRGAYFPFGGGPRMCIGASFAQVEAKLLLASMIQRFHFEPKIDSMELLPSITLRPKNGLPMALRAV